jgi:hypothetical protein
MIRRKRRAHSFCSHVPLGTSECPPGDTWVRHPASRARQVTAASCKRSDLPALVDLAPARETYVSQLLTQARSAEKPLRGSPSTEKNSVYLDCPLAQRNQLPGYVTTPTYNHEKRVAMTDEERHTITEFLAAIRQLRTDENGIAPDYGFAELNPIAKPCFAVEDVTAAGKTPEEILLHRVARLTGDLITTVILGEGEALCANGSPHAASYSKSVCRHCNLILSAVFSSRQK